MTIKPEPFESLLIALATGPVDLAANTTILPAEPDLTAAQAGIFDDEEYGTREVFVQCVAGSARWRESATEPSATDSGHLLSLGDGVVATLTRGRPFWFWGTTATLAVSPASAAPIRDATFDQPVTAA